MQYINKEVFKILWRVKDLLPLERKMREDRNVVIPLPSTSDKGSLPTSDKAAISSQLPGSSWQQRFARDAKPKPWKRIPSIWRFEIHLAVHDWLLLLFNLFKRYDSATTLYAWKNGKANKYIDYMFRRLEKQVKHELYEDASKTMWLTMNSHSYQVCCLNYVAKGWYKSMELNEVKRVMRNISKLVKQKATKIDYKRVYLEEPTKFRPLGVPTLAWRVYLHMYNNLVTQWRMVSEKGNQHAYLPGKGVISAWENLFTLLHTEPNIYEADFKGFFNNVTHEGIDYVLWEIGFPQAERDFMRELNGSIPKLTSDDKIHEPDRNFPFLSSGKFNPEAGMEQFPGLILRETIGSALPNPFALDDDGRPPLIRYNGELYEPDELIWIRSKERASNLMGIPIIQGITKDKGVPQGAPTSCSLATLSLRYLEKLYKILFYADDVIYFPKDPNADHVRALSDFNRGLIVHEGKSKLVKRNHEWLTDSIKFLGFRYYPETYYDTIWESMGYYFWLILALDLILLGFPLFSLLFGILAYKQRWERHKPRFRADTRNGASLEFSDKESLIMYLNNARTLLLNSSAGDYLGGPKLTKFLVENYGRWLRIHNPVSLLFELNTQKKLKPENWSHAHIPLTGWMMARLQSDSWNISISQDFRLKAIRKSWVNLCWASYSRSQNLSVKAISTFTASSFACHDLLMWKENRSRPGRIRFTTSRDRKSPKT
jgi:hypothetical protein